MFLVVFNNFFIIPVTKENAIVNSTLVIPTGVATTVA